MSLISTEMDSDPSSPLSGKKNSTIFVRNVTGNTIEHQASLSESVANFKLQVGKAMGLLDASQVQLCFGDLDLTTGTLASNGVYDGARLNMTVSMKSGPIRFGNVRGQMSEDSVRQIVEGISSMFPAGLDQPISVELDPTRQKLIVSFGSKPAGDVESPSFTEPQVVAPVPMDESDYDSLSQEEKEQRRAVYQQIADRMREEARATKQRTCEQKRTASKLEELQARMRRKKAAQERACYSTSTKLPSGAAPAAPAALPPRAQPRFGGMRQGFLNSGNSKLQSGATASVAAPSAPSLSAPAPSAAGSAAAHPAPSRSAESPAQAPHTFGGLRRGFLNSSNARASGR